MKKHFIRKRAHRHSHGVFGIDYFASQSRLRHWNGCYKAAAAVITLTLCLSLDNPLVSAAVFLSMGAVNIWANGVKVADYLGLIKIPMAFLLLGSAAVAVELTRQPAGEYYLSLRWFCLNTGWEGISRALELFMKSMGAVGVLYFFALSTPAGELVAVLRRLRLPKLIIELMYMVYRFIFILSEVHQNMRTACVSRLGDADFRTSCRSFGQIGGNLWILSLKKADAYYDAMASRGYEGDFPVWEENESVKVWQILLLAIYAGGLVLLCKLPIVYFSAAS